MLSEIKQCAHKRRVGAPARVEQNFIHVAGGFLEQFPGPLARSPPWGGYVARWNPTDDSDVGSRRINLRENQPTASRVRTKREHIEALRVNARGLKGPPNCYCRFKCPATFSIFGSSDD